MTLHEIAHQWAWIGWVAGAALCLFVAPRSEGRSVQWNEGLTVTLLEYKLQDYYDEFGVYPITDATGSWWEKLVAAGRLDRSSWGDRQDELLDSKGDTYHYTPLDDPSVRVDPEVHPLIWWTGANGVFDGGRRDDFSPYRPARIGYYWKRSWPEAIRWSILIALCLPLVGWGAWVVGRKRWWIVVFAIAACLVAAAHALVPMYFKWSEFYPSSWDVHQSAMRMPRRAVAVYVPALLLAIVVSFVRGRLRRWKGCCRHCGYDMRGLASGRCPECGSEATTQETDHPGRRG